MTLPVHYFRTPQQVICGFGALARLGEVAASLGPKVLVVTGARSAVASGTLDRVRACLIDAGLKVHVMAAVASEPTDTVIDEIREALKRESCSGVVAVGGGSALDAGKAAAGLYYSEASTHLHMVDKAEIPATGLPWIAIPTTAGSGAEMTPNAVVTDTVTGIKKSLRSWTWLAQAALVDPELTYTMPSAVTAGSGMDALTQAIESYTSRGATPLTEAISLEATRRIANHLLRAYTNPKDAEAREAVAWGSMMAGMALANARLGAVHGFAHPVGTHCGLAHGTACAVMLPSVIQFNAPVAGEKYARLAHALGLVPAGAEPEQGTEALLRFVRDLNSRLGIPERLGDAGLTADMIPAIVAETLPSGSLAANPRKADAADLTALLQSHLR